MFCPTLGKGHRGFGGRHGLAETERSELGFLKPLIRRRAVWTRTTDGRDPLRDPLRGDATGVERHRGVERPLGVTGPLRGDAAGRRRRQTRVATGGTYDDAGQRLGPDTAVSIRVISRNPCRHASRFAFKLAMQRKTNVVSTSKWTIQKVTDGFFEEICGNVSEDYPGVEYRRELFDALDKGRPRDAPPLSIADVAVALWPAADATPSEAGERARQVLEARGIALPRTVQ